MRAFVYIVTFLLLSILLVRLIWKSRLRPIYKVLSSILALAVWISFLAQGSAQLFILAVVYSIFYSIVLDKNPTRIRDILFWDSSLLFFVYCAIFFTSDDWVMDAVSFPIVLVNMLSHLLFFKLYNPFEGAFSERQEKSSHFEESPLDLYTYTADYISHCLGQNQSAFGEDILENVESLLKQSPVFTDYTDGMMAQIRRNRSSAPNRIPKMYEIPLYMQREAGRVIMMLSLCGSGKFQDNASNLATSLRLFPISKSVRLNLLSTYQSLECYKAFALLMKRMATLSGIVSEVENKSAYKFFSCYRKKRINSMPVSSYLRMIYDYVGEKDLKTVSEEALKYLFLFDKKELEEFISALFKVAEAEDGIVYPELNFAYRCAAHAGFSDAEFLSFCRCFKVEWTKGYEGENIYGGEETKRRFFTDRKSFWEQMRTGGSQKKNSQKKRRQKEQRQQEKRRSETLSHMDRYYEILQVSKNVPFEEIKKSYRKMALKNHPDRLGPDATPEEIEAANERFVEINDAYKILCEQRK